MPDISCQVSACDPRVDQPALFSRANAVKAVCFAATVIFVILLCLDLRRGHGNTFSVFYFAAKAVAAGGDIYKSHSPGSDRCEYVYPPLFAVLIVPLTYFKVAAATRIWTLIDAVLTLVAVTVASAEALRRFRIRATRPLIAAVAAAGVLLGIGEIKTELGTSQTDTLVLVSFVLALAWLDQWPILCGLALGFGCNIKYQTLIALPYLLITRRWKAAASTAISSAGFALLPGFLVGFARNIQYLRSALGGLGHFASIDTAGAAGTVSLTWDRSVSITSAIGRLLASCGINSSHAVMLTPLVAVFLLVLARQLYRRHGIAMAPVGVPFEQAGHPREALVAMEWTGLMVAWLVFGPEVSRRHMFVLLLMHIIAVALVLASRGRRRYLLIVGLLVCQAGLRIPSGPFGDAFNRMGGASWCLLAFYGTLLSSGFEWLRDFPALPFVKALPPLRTRRQPVWRVQHFNHADLRSKLVVSPE